MQFQQKACHAQHRIATLRFKGKVLARHLQRRFLRRGGQHAQMIRPDGQDEIIIRSPTQFLQPRWNFHAVRQVQPAIFGQKGGRTLCFPVDKAYHVPILSRRSVKVTSRRKRGLLNQIG